MRLFQFDRDAGREIDQFDSLHTIITRVGQASGGTTVHCLYIGPNGIVGRHPTEQPQLFLVVRGVGWVRAESPRRTRITPGQAAFWEAGEWHESGSVTGMVAIVIEGEGLSPPVRHITV